jgi:hypothetical protein
MRKGSCRTTIRATAGLVALATPILRGTGERFAAQLFGTGVPRSNALAALVIAFFGRGLSIRDVEATLAWHFVCHVNAAAEAVPAAWDIAMEASADRSAPGAIRSA